MKILILEDSGYLQDQMKDAVKKMHVDGHFVCVACHCYSNIDGVIAALKQCPDMIIADTTFSYYQKLPKLFDLAKYIPASNEKIKICISSFKPELLLEFMPAELWPRFELYSYNPVEYYDFGFESALFKIK